MTPSGPSPPPTIDLDDLGFDRGGHLLVDHALRSLPVGGAVVVAGTDPHLALHLRAWARTRGHRVQSESDGDRDGVVKGSIQAEGESERATVVKGSAQADRWRDATRAGHPVTPAPTADPRWGLAARGALVEEGGPPLAVADLVHRDEVWADVAPKLYAQAAAGQWDPETAIDWSAESLLPDEVENAVVQIMTFLVENEQAALVVPARHLARIHPQYREVSAFLATQIADEARHVEVFSRRALLHRDTLGTSSIGGRASLQTLLDEPDFSVASFLLTVLGEGTFLDLLSFLERRAPDPVTRRIAHLTRQDEARHVAFGQAHLEHRVSVEPRLGERLRAALEQRHDTLRATAGLNSDVHDALVLLAAGRFSADAVATGWALVQQLQQTMHEGRQRRLVRLGFPAEEAAALSELHTRNFM